jgi:hypothetical protein
VPPQRDPNAPPVVVPEEPPSELDQLIDRVNGREERPPPPLAERRRPPRDPYEEERPNQ